jgi:class I fructose-bisphosphate aldolase
LEHRRFLVGIREKRMQRLFGEDGKAVYLPIDHGIFGMVEGLEDPVKMARELIKDGIDGTLMQLGIVKQTNALFESVNRPPARVLTADYLQQWSVPGKSEETTGAFLNATAEQAVKYSCDAVKVILPMGFSSELELEHVKIISALVKECDKYDMPIIMEPMVMGNRIPKERERDPEIIAHGCRIALELGADVIKAPYTGDKDSFALLIERIGLPFIILGGPKVPGIKGVLQIVKDTLDAGARGPCMGRNIWGRPEVHRIVHALIDIVHNGATVEGVLSKYSLD